MYCWFLLWAICGFITIPGFAQNTATTTGELVFVLPQAPLSDSLIILLLGIIGIMGGTIIWMLRFISGDKTITLPEEGKRRLEKGMIDKMKADFDIKNNALDTKLAQTKNRFTKVFMQVRDLTTTLEPERIFNAIVNILLNELGVEKFILLLHDRECDELYPFRWAKFQDDECAKILLPVQDEHLITVAFKNKRLIYRDTAVDDPNLRALVGRPPLKNVLLAVPIFTPKATFGVIHIEGFKDARTTVDTDDIRLLIALGSFMGLALENADVFLQTRSELTSAKILSEKELAEKKRLKEMFSRFVSADVVHDMMEHPDRVKPGGQKCELTIFFSDVAGFTTISEMLSPEDLVVLMNEYLGAMTNLLFKHGGTLDKYIGDAVMAFWNCPREQNDHAVRACLYAIEMQSVIKELQKSWLERGLPKAYARAGINTSEVVVGFMGASDRMNYTCLGDGVNLASRLEGANKEYGTLLMISDATYQKVKNRITARFLDFLAVKGKSEPVKVYELVCQKGQEPEGFFKKLELYHIGIKFHNDRNWDDSVKAFENLLALFPEDGASKAYINRCREYKENPPAEKWDLSYHLTHK